jgi:hypothetical protein
MPTCPNGHQSGSDDWCEVCGHRMAGPGAPAGAVPPPPPPPAYGYPGPGDPNATAQAEICPQCRTPREAMAPFCEECRYNFLTHTATSYTPVAPSQQQPSGLNLPPGFQSQPAPAPAPPPPSVPQQPDPYDYQGSRPSQMNRPAEPLMNDPSAQQQPPQAFLQQGPPPPPPSFQQQQSPHSPPPPSFQQPSAPPMPQQPQQTGGGDDWMLSPPSQQPQAPQAPQQPLAQQQPQAFQQQMPQQYAQQPGPQPGPQQGQPGQPQGQPGPQQPPRYQTQAPAGWTAVIAPDREYFLAMMQRSGPDATGLNLPAYSPEQHLPLGGNQITIGRRRHSTGESPDIDLSVPPEDPGVSHQHAVLVQQPDGSWAVVDQNSTNGTTLNGAEEPIQPYVPIPLNDGDRVHVGAWTTITIRRG